MLDALRDVAARGADPQQRLWNVLDAYLATFADKPHAAFLWFEYWVSAGRRGVLDATDHMLGKVHAFLCDLLDDLPVDDPDETAHLLLSWLLGTVVQQHIRPRMAAALHDEVTTMLANAMAS
jgi:hypothetical protein